MPFLRQSSELLSVPNNKDNVIGGKGQVDLLATPLKMLGFPKLRVLPL